jgi:dihydroneopterin aldolase
VDTVYLKRLRIDTIIGIHPWERRVRQTLLLDLELGVDCAVAAASESVADTVDYTAVAACATDYVIAGEFRLLETLAQGLAAELMERFDLPRLRLRVAKPGAVVSADEVGVVIERGQRPT